MKKEPQKLSLADIARRQDRQIMPPAGGGRKKQTYIAVPVANKLPKK